MLIIILSNYQLCPLPLKDTFHLSLLAQVLLNPSLWILIKELGLLSPIHTSSKCDVNLTPQLCSWCIPARELSITLLLRILSYSVPICDVNIRNANCIHRKYELSLRVLTYLFTEKVVLFAKLYDDNWVSDILLLTCRCFGDWNCRQKNKTNIPYCYTWYFKHIFQAQPKSFCIYNIICMYN